MGNHEDNPQRRLRFIIWGAVAGALVGLALTLLPPLISRIAYPPQSLDPFSLFTIGVSLRSAWVFAHLFGLEWHESDGGMIVFTATVLNCGLLCILGGIIGDVVSSVVRMPRNARTHNNL